MLMNPKPMTPYRDAEYADGKWLVRREVYGPAPVIQTSAAADVGEALDGLRGLVRQNRGFAAVYVVDAGSPRRIGAVLLRTPLPAGYVPKPVIRSKPQ